ncbi:MAG TPA: hypothetical protein VMA72_25865 [Streptosporangiaceae bacterium]|nr:hypothetical protein [Streptosporangiaceae bacterium]
MGEDAERVALQVRGADRRATTEQVPVDAADSGPAGRTDGAERQRPHPGQPLDQFTGGNGAVRPDDRLQVLAGFGERPVEQLLHLLDVGWFLVHRPVVA